MNRGNLFRSALQTYLNFPQMSRPRVSDQLAPIYCAFREDRDCYGINSMKRPIIYPNPYLLETFGLISSD